MYGIAFAAIHILYADHFVRFAIWRESATAGVGEGDDFAALFFGAIAEHELSGKGSFAVTVIVRPDKSYCVFVTDHCH
jgi:hypothetical protein